MVLICIESVFALIYSTLSTSSAKIVLICNCHCYCYPLFLVFLVFFVYPVIFVYPVSFVYWVFFVHCTMRAHCILLNCIPLFLSSMPHWALQRGKSKCVRNNFIFHPKWLEIQKYIWSTLVPNWRRDYVLYVLYIGDFLFLYVGVCLLLWSIARSHILMVIQEMEEKRTPLLSSVIPQTGNKRYGGGTTSTIRNQVHPSIGDFPAMFS